jgi:hypothetical protein
MLNLLGSPRDDYSEDCQSPTNPRIKSLIVVDDVGPFKVRGLRPAVETMKLIFADVKKANKDLYDRLAM